jgi:hypothetical protein
MMNIREFLELIDRHEVASRLGFRPQDVSRAIKEGTFPAGWYPFIRALCVERHIATPDHLFRWSRVPKKNALSGFLPPAPPQAVTEGAA